MSVEKIQLLHDDYIRLTERFKALWTFNQFLRGVYKTFFSSEPGYKLDFNALYEEIRAVAAQINTALPEAVAPRLRELWEKLDAFARELRETDRRVSPSFVRRFFEKVRPQDEKIAFHLLRFYFSQSEVDEDVIDKVDFLATVAATGRADPEASLTRPRVAIQKLFESVTAASVWPRLESGMTPPIVRAFDELATDMNRAREFEDLVSERLLNNVRTMKRRVASGLANPDILTAVACCNLTTRSVFHRLYEKEERRLDEATGRITDLERELTRGGEEKASEEFRRFRESRIRYDRQATERNLRAQHIHELKHAISEVLQKFDISGLEAQDIDEALELVEEVEGEEHEAAFWKPSMDRLLGAVELYDEGHGPVRPEIPGLAHLKLEPWELLAARKTVAAGGEPPSDRDRALLQAAVLRVKAEQELEALAASAAPSPDLLRAARATLARASQLDARMTVAIEEAHLGEAEAETRSWTRSRFRLLGATADLWLGLDEVERQRASPTDIEG
ncbi:MAG: hypothetical protein ABR576_15510 [Thermoanaerobaculia bacterium]